jgi:hypothetical protein
MFRSSNEPVRPETVKHRLLLLVAMTWLGALPAAGQPAANRAIVQEIKVPLPPTPCTVTTIASRIAQVVEEPAGIEHWAEDEKCPVPPLRRTEGVVDWLTLTGLTAHEALDRLMQLDSRYEWREIDSVIVVRPRIAWTDPNDFLHRTVSSFTVQNKHLGSTLEAIIDVLGPFHWPAGERFVSTTLQADRVISMNLVRGTTSIIDVLNAVVRTHGAMSWSVRYCGSGAVPENAWLSLLTFDGGGTGRPVFPNDVDGRHSSCAGQGSR